MQQQSDPSTPMAWCHRCARYVSETHPLIHELVVHCPAYSKGTFPARSRAA